MNRRTPSFLSLESNATRTNILSARAALYKYDRMLSILPHDYYRRAHHNKRPITIISQHDAHTFVCFKICWQVPYNNAAKGVNQLADTKAEIGNTAVANEKSSFYVSNDVHWEYETDDDVAQVFASSNTLEIFEYWSLTPRRGACTSLEWPCYAALPLRSTIVNAEPILRDTVVDAEPILRDTVVDAEPILRDTVDNAEPILRDTVVDAEPILRDTVVDAEPILRDTVVDAESILRSTFLHSRGSWQRGSTVLHRWARGSDSRDHGDSQARRQEGHHDTWECEEQSPDVFGLGIRLHL
ncbi:hypothetical protein N7475_003612 [Penicillium sp. IBT 31633x]|nr:hypothetical protein N7475_003612 [Penicillium sp. IBT 31633x]